ncbi:MAG: DUF3006 domain-containing protein [Ruminococcus flavefaciens]|nr:DUF3006 domain-containing protein [Ruminococcus flavefaciens]MCM1361807.1 DUF3006 domain-containing protein [Clostridiales bacterium]MCM1435707.1 DUF3006 domain-containing protein [Ruminococcus flavefaciens]
MIIIDRFEDDKAVLETDSGMQVINRELLPAESNEGDVVIFENNAYFIDRKYTDERRKAMEEKLRRLLS